MASPDTTSPTGAIRPWRGRLRVPGSALDGHLALVLAAVTVGRSTLAGIGGDAAAMIAALRLLGCRIESMGEGAWAVDGVGLGGLAEPLQVLEPASGGPGLPLLLALAAMQPMTTVFAGDPARGLRLRQRLSAAFETCGAGFVAPATSLLPMTVLGAANPLAMAREAMSSLERAALMLAALQCPGETIISHVPVDDGVDAIFTAFGAELDVTRTTEGTSLTRIRGQPELRPAQLSLPGDTTAVIAIAVAALSRPGSDLVLEGLEPHERLARACAGFTAFGGDAVLTPMTGDRLELRLGGGSLRGARIAAGPDLPLLAVLAALASGRSILSGWEGQRDRLAGFAEGLRACGVVAQSEAAGLAITGTGGVPPRGGWRCPDAIDHRARAAFLLLGLSAAAPITVGQDSELDDDLSGLPDLLSRLADLPDSRDQA